jgi:hypothetical protein
MINPTIGSAMVMGSHSECYAKQNPVAKKGVSYEHLRREFVL